MDKECDSNMALSKPKLIIVPDYEKYVNINRYWSFPDYRFFLLFGGRGIGKTTGACIKAVQSWIKTGSEFIYVRRYKTELMKSKGILDKIIPGVAIQGIGKGGFEYRWENRRIGFGATLALQSSFKSGVDFSKVNLMIFDEAVLKPNGNLRYLKDEMTEFFELVSTVFRSRKDYRVLILGNNLDLFNPFFEYFDVPKFKGQWASKERGLFAELILDKEAFMKEQRETPLYKLTAGTAYGDYHYKNEVLIPDDGNVEGSESKGQFVFRLVYNQTTVNFYWHKTRPHELYCEDRPRAIEDEYSFTLFTNGKPNYFYCKSLRSGDIGKLISAKYGKGEISYSSQECHAVVALIAETVLK